MPLITFEEYDGNPPDGAELVFAAIEIEFPRPITSKVIERKLEMPGPNGILPGSFGRLCREYGILTPLQRQRSKS